MLVTILNYTDQAVFRSTALLMALLARAVFRTKALQLTQVEEKLPMKFPSQSFNSAYLFQFHFLLCLHHPPAVIMIILQIFKNQKVFL